MKNNVLALLFIILYMYSSVDFCKCDFYDNFKNVISNKDFDLICLRKNRDVGLEQKTNEIFGAIEQKIRGDQWTIIVFSEYFFNAIGNPLESGTVKNIVGKCQTFTKGKANIIIHINFLHKFRTTDPIDQIKWLRNMANIDEPYGIINGRDIPERIIEDSRLLPGEANFKHEQQSQYLCRSSVVNRISNYSLVIWNGEPISIYRKSTYCDEANTYCCPYSDETDICNYEFGDFASHEVIWNNFQHMRQAFSNTKWLPQIMFTGICSDMNLRFWNDLDISLRPNNPPKYWKVQMRKPTGAQGHVLIVPADGSPDFDWKNNIGSSFILVDNQKDVFSDINLSKIDSVGDGTWNMQIFSTNAPTAPTVMIIQDQIEDDDKIIEVDYKDCGFCPVMLEQRPIDNKCKCC